MTLAWCGADWLPRKKLKGVGMCYGMGCIHEDPYTGDCGGQMPCRDMDNAGEFADGEEITEDDAA